MNTPETSHLTLLATQSCPKLLITAEGKLTYNVWYDTTENHLFIALTHNEGGGYFSHELVPVNKIIEYLDVLKTLNQAFPAVRLRHVFEGKSANNSSFLGAVLRHLEVLVPCPKNNKLHLVCDDLNSWPERLMQLKPLKSDLPTTSDGIATPTIKTSKTRAKTAEKEVITPSVISNHSPLDETEAEHESHSPT